MFRRLLIWIMLFALPLQGIAAAAMVHCAPSHHRHAALTQQTHGMHHGEDHNHAMNDVDRHGHAHHMHALADAMEHAQSGDDSDPSASGSPQYSDKCSACSACCLGGMAVLENPSGWYPPNGSSLMTPPEASALPSVFLKGPRRPPRSSFA